jgi:hypothetical protein
MWNSVRLRARDFSGEVNLENSDRLDDVEGKGICKSVGVAFAHMSECGDVFDAKKSTGGAKDPEILDSGHVQSRTGGHAMRKLWGSQRGGRGAGGYYKCSA